mgnify:CR=1 FL=1
MYDWMQVNVLAALQQAKHPEASTRQRHSGSMGPQIGAKAGRQCPLCVNGGLVTVLCQSLGEARPTHD